MNLGRFLSRSSIYWSDLEALVFKEQRLTYRQLEERTNQLASALLARGIATGQSIATFADNCAEAVETEMAAYKAGYLRVPISARLSKNEVSHIIKNADVAVLFVDAAHGELAKEAVAESGAQCLVVDYENKTAGALSYQALLDEGLTDLVAVELEDSAPAVLHFTSGSTGTLKAAVQTQGNRLANLRKRIMSPVGAPAPGHCYLISGPITHASGMGVLSVLSRGGKIVVLPKWDVEEFLRLLVEEKITSTFLVPVMLHQVLEHKEKIASLDLSRLNCLLLGGAPVSPQRLREAVATFGPIVMQEYGQGETTSVITSLTREDIVRGVEKDPELLTSAGRALYDSEVRIVDESFAEVPLGSCGEIVVRGPDCVSEYWGEVDLTEETFYEGWVLTGDIGYLREDGYLFIVDRKKDMIISGGYNIFSSEVEAALYDHPAVFEACVIGIPDEQWGESVKAVVVLKEGGTLTEKELIEFCDGRLASVKKPRSIDFADALPVNRNGKIDRRQVRNRYWANQERNV